MKQNTYIIIIIILLVGVATTQYFIISKIQKLSIKEKLNPLRQIKMILIYQKLILKT
jgi:hypothetical protein